jgi:hypothetical protein
VTSPGKGIGRGGLGNREANFLPRLAVGLSVREVNRVTVFLVANIVDEPRGFRVLEAPTILDNIFDNIVSTTIIVIIVITTTRVLTARPVLDYDSRGSLKVAIVPLIQ